MAITKLILNNIKYDIGNTTYFSVHEGLQMYDDNVYGDRELDQYEWSQIDQILIHPELASQYSIKVGDYKTLILSNGEVIKMRIAGIDTYYNRNFSSYKHHIDWISDDCLIESCSLNSVDDYLNNTIFNRLTNDLQNLIKSKRNIGDDNNYIDKFWLPCEYEVFGSIICGEQEKDVQYQLFANTCRYRIKGQGNGGNPCHWWLSTTAAISDTAGCCVLNTGCVIPMSKTSSWGIPLCFTFAETAESE